MEQKVFDDIKRAVAQDTLLAYPYFNQRFDIHKNDSDYRLGAMISQNDKLISFHICKLTVPQTRYIVREKESLSIV